MSMQSEAGLLARILDTVAAWRQRAHDRDLLAQLNERQRRDIGLTPKALDTGIGMPLWRA